MFMILIFKEMRTEVKMDWQYLFTTTLWSQLYYAKKKMNTESQINMSWLLAI